ncbi:MAG: S-layer homology domain-containing protein [Clostridiaceae bacterium]|nr:S-layer homology domain-containing protein [Clostridiaceae bacterium]
MVKKIVSVITVVLLIFNYSYATINYSDIQQHWSREYVYWGTGEITLFNGYEDGTFRPDQSITIAEYLSILNRILYLQHIHSISSVKNQDMDMPYKDIKKGHWAYEDITEIIHYIDNYSTTSIKFQDIFSIPQLRPDEFITRYEASLLARAITTPPIKVLDTTPKDIPEDMNFYREIKELMSNNIIFGYGDGTFGLENNITRGEAATIIKRIYEDLGFVKKDLLKPPSVNITKNQKSSLLFQMEATDSPQNHLDVEFIEAITALEYMDFIGFIPYEERHLYDVTPIDTLWQLKNQHYYNVIGTNYYIIKYDKELGIERKIELIKEAFLHYGTISEQRVEGMYSFLQSSKKYVPLQELITMTGEAFNAANDSHTKWEIGIFLTEGYLKQDRTKETIAVYEELLKDHKEIETKTELIANYGYLVYQMEGQEKAVSSLYNQWEKLKRHKEYSLYKKDIDYLLVGMMKQMIIKP